MRTIRTNLRASVLLFALAALTTVIAPAQQPTASGYLNVSVDNWDGIGIVFYSDASGVTLAGAGSDTATLNFGTVSAFGTTTNGVTVTRSANSFVMSSPFQIYVNHGGIFGSSSFNMSAALASNPGVFTYKLSGTTLTTNSVAISTNDTRYGQNVQYTLSISVPSTAAPQNVGNAVNFSLVAN